MMPLVSEIKPQPPKKNMKLDKIENTVIEKVVIEKGIPIPVGIFPRGEASQNLKKMKVGDSVLAKTFAVAARYREAARRLGCKIAQRQLDDGTYRVWRLND